MSKYFYIKLANQTIQIHCNYPYSYQLCRDYIVPAQQADFSVAVTEADIAREKLDSPEFSNGYLEGICLYRKIAEQLPVRNRMVFHGAAIQYGTKGLIFTAPSGTGKSTHIGLWKKYYKDAVKVVNGDKPVLSVEDSGVKVWGTPWAGKEGWQRNCSADLSALCFLKRGTENRIRRLKPEECLNDLMGQVYLPEDMEAAACTLELLDRLLKKVPVFSLECDISEEAVRCSFRALIGENT